MRLFRDLSALKVDAFADLHNVLRAQVVRTLFALSGKETAAVDHVLPKIKAVVADAHGELDEKK